MPVTSCPNCGAFNPRELSGPDLLTVKRYRCGDCGHVWTTDKQTQAIVEHITPLTKKPPAKT